MCPVIIGPYFAFKPFFLINYYYNHFCFFFLNQFSMSFDFGFVTPAKL